MPSMDELKERIDLHELAEKLGLERPGGHGNYRSPHHKDKNPSLSIYADARRWRDHSADVGGSCIDLVMHVCKVEAGDAFRKLHELYGWEMRAPREVVPDKPMTKVEYIASQCRHQTDAALEYLVQQRKIPEAVVQAAIRRGSVGFNDWRSTKMAPGEIGHGGPAVAFIVRDSAQHIAAVDMRFLQPDLNGGVKTQTHGEKFGVAWVNDHKALAKAHTVYVVESAINALSIEAVTGKGCAAMAIRGTSNAALIDYRALVGKRVLLCMDNDAPDEAGKCPGNVAAWTIHEAMTALNIAVHLVDQSSWIEKGWNDVNDILCSAGASELKMALHPVEPWIIPGLPGKTDLQQGRPRLFIPAHDFSVYWRFRAKDDFVSYVKKYDVSDEDGQEKLEFEDVSGFRVAAISRVTIASGASVMTGEVDNQPRTSFAVSVQTPRHGNQLLRRVVEDERLHNADHWQKFGPIFARTAFLRMINILERGANIGARAVINFVGLGWQQGRPVVNEGPDCYFTEPEKQCPYHNLIFPSGRVSDARLVIGAFQNTFRNNAANQLLVWALGGHLKAFLGFWPHMILQAEKSAGKTTLSKKLERAIGMTMLSGQSLATEFRLLTSVSHTTHPIGWEELSARRQDIIDKAVSLLQESYSYSCTRRGSEMTEYLPCAPVLLVGEDVPVPSLLSKVVRTSLSKKRRGNPISDTLPRFPMRQWLQFLAGLNRTRVQELYDRARTVCIDHCCAIHDDAGASRIVENYAALLMCWWWLCEFAELSVEQGNFQHDLIAEMNRHISETKADRQPWVWILDIFFNEIAAGKFRYPYQFREEYLHGEPVQVLLVRPTHIIAHLSSEISLREKWNGLPIKSARVFAGQLKEAGVLFADASGNDRFDMQINKSRECHLKALNLRALESYGLHVGTPQDAEA